MTQILNDRGPPYKFASSLRAGSGRGRLVGEVGGDRHGPGSLQEARDRESCMVVHAEPVITSHQLISFGEFRLDRRTRRLRRRGTECRLRPKSSGVLLYLAERPNRLVTRQELLRNVWPDATVAALVGARLASGSPDEEIARPIQEYRAGHPFDLVTLVDGLIGQNRSSLDRPIDDALRDAGSRHRYPNPEHVASVL